MAKISNREKILDAGLRLVHERGFGAAGVRDIVQAAGVPQGSFTNHFPSKEAFGLEILEMYFANSREVIAATLRNDDRDPLERLRAYFQANKDHVGMDGMRNGCLLGNFSAEVVDHSERMRLRLVEIFAEVRGAVAYCLNAAVAVGEVRADLDVETISGFIVSGLQGSILLAKAERDIAPVERFEETLFSAVLR
ncbi:MAG: TetR family transcriptional regulator [Caulobacteraceae bacterium]|nr:TetR family transcriptional regulator [Caulobacteraceae bacterium]